jgi:hypothetical protein
MAPSGHASTPNYASSFNASSVSLIEAEEMLPCHYFQTAQATAHKRN